jgi:hypothetical protein
MPTLNALTRYFEASLMTVIGLVALAGIGRTLLL